MKRMKQHNELLPPPVEQETVINLNPRDFLSTAFKRIPSNANINKGRCGNGGTTMELGDSRHSAIVVPNVSIITEKKKRHSDLICVFGDVSIPEIAQDMESYFKSNPNGYLKVMSTPDSFYKFIAASEKIHFDVFSECFLLMDESHSIATEGLYRKNISRPLDYFEQFKNKSLMSATPFESSDPKLQALKSIRIKTEHLNNKIKIVFSESVVATLKHVIQHCESSDVNLHIFYNSVNAIYELLHLIKANKDSNINVFCAANEENIAKLDEFSDLLKVVENHIELPINKINLYTTKYYEGWDLNDEKAVLILVSDINLPHTCIGITNKAVQAFGRLRNSAQGMYHITNTFEGESAMSKEQILTNTRNDVDIKINYYNQGLELFTFRNQTGNDIIRNNYNLIADFAVIDQDSQRASLDYSKFDAIANNEIARSQYTNRETVISAWQEANFEVADVHSTVMITKRDESLLKKERIAAGKKNRLLFEKFRDLEFSIKNHKYNPKDGVFSLNLGQQEEMDRLKKTYPRLYKYFETLGFDRVKELKFKTACLEKEFIKHTASQTEVSKELKKMVDTTFKPGKFYPSAYTKSTITDFYNSFGLNMTVTGSFINKFFVTKEITKRIDGIPTKGYELIMNRI